MKMKSYKNNFVNVMDSDNEKPSGSEDRSCEVSAQDPLNGIDSIPQENRFYRLNSIVFAEPLDAAINGTHSNDSGPGQIAFIDNVIVEKRTGKRNKYYINVDVKKPKCPQPNCGRVFATATLLKAHVRKVHCANRNSYVCEYCGSGFAAKYLLGRHMAVHENRKIMCPVCKKMLSERTNLAQHLRSHSNSRSHECQICRKLFLRSATLATHVKFVHRNGDLRCDTCGMRLDTRTAWTRHRRSHGTRMNTLNIVEST